MTRKVRVQSLAKINLDLRVLAKRRDGFHDLRTVFQTISLADTIDISFEPARRRDLAIEDALGIADNLIFRAANAVLDQMKVAARVRFKLEKRIPMGGGLGGGSSNAAAVLLALPVLAGKVVPMERLMKIGYGLGSDVPFFLHGGTELGFGAGDGDLSSTGRRPGADFVAYAGCSCGYRTRLCGAGAWFDFHRIVK